MAKLIVTRDDLRPQFATKAFDDVTINDVKVPSPAIGYVTVVEFVDEDDQTKTLKDDGGRSDTFKPDYLERKDAEPVLREKATKGDKKSK